MLMTLFWILQAIVQQIYLNLAIENSNLWSLATAKGSVANSLLFIFS